MDPLSATKGATAKAVSTLDCTLMDLLDATASIIAILQLSSKVLVCLNDVKDTSKHRAECAIEGSPAVSFSI